jgi:transposase
MFVAFGASIKHNKLIPCGQYNQTASTIFLQPATGSLSALSWSPTVSFNFANSSKAVRPCRVSASNPVEIIHALPESELVGPNGEQYVEIGRDISEQLDIVPADVKVLKHIRLKYAVKGQEELGVKIAPMVSTILPKSIAAPGLLAHVAESKYCHHLPLYRQEQIWNGLDIKLPRYAQAHLPKIKKTKSA